MTRGRHPQVSLRGTAALAVVLAFLVQGGARAETWYEAYDRAEAAIGREAWSEAVSALNTAIEQRPASGDRVRTYGMRFIEYYPFLLLGIAYSHLGQADAALQAFETEIGHGAIERSAEAMSRLRSNRQRVEQERTVATSDRAERARDVVAAAIEEAGRLERAAQLEDALDSIARALAVAPEHAEARAIRQRLLDTLTEQQRARDRAARHDRVFEAGNRALRAGNLEEAAARFAEALEIQPTAEARQGLEDTQERLRSAVADRDAAARQQRLSSALDRAESLAARGQNDAALAALQIVLAGDPTHAEAQALDRRLRQARQTAETESSARDAATKDLLLEAGAALDEGDWERAISRANRALVRSPGDPEASTLLARAYRGLGDILLAADRGPPAITIDGRATGADGAAEPEPMTVRTSELVLSGRVYDSGPVDVSVAIDGGPEAQVEAEGRPFQGVWITDFEWRHRLSPGPSNIEVVAIDRDGNRTRLAVPAVYTVPFLRTPAFPVSVAALLLALVGIAFGRRAQRRHTLLRGRFNPYIAGAPILQQERFFGRQDLLDYVLRRIGNNSVMLHGERRIGKTSFQHRLKRCLAQLDDPDFAFFPVFVDLQGTPQDVFFATLGAEIFHELSAKLDGLEPQVAPTGPHYGYRELVQDLHRVLKVLGGRTTKHVKLVLLIDEVDELNDYDPRVNQRLRSLFMRAFADRLVSVVSGVSIKKQWEREGSPWYNFFQEIEVQPLDPAEARDLIEAPVRGVFRFEDGAASEIVRRTDSKPYLIQRLCSRLVDRMHEEGRTMITGEDVEAACRLEAI